MYIYKLLSTFNGHSSSTHEVPPQLAVFFFIQAYQPIFIAPTRRGTYEDWRGLGVLWRIARKTSTRRSRDSNSGPAQCEAETEPLEPPRSHCISYLRIFSSTTCVPTVFCILNLVLGNTGAINGIISINSLVLYEETHFASKLYNTSITC